MMFRHLAPCIVLICATISLVVMAGEPNGNHGCKTIEELFSAYKKAKEARDWKSLFLLGTRERQDGEILMVVVSAARSHDVTFRSLVEKHGANWKQFDHEWTEADSQRFARDSRALAASIGKEVRNKAELYAAANSYLDKRSDPASTEVHELKNLVRHGATAVGESIESRTCIMRIHDADGNQGQVPQTFSVRSELRFRQIDGYWYRD